MAASPPERPHTWSPAVPFCLSRCTCFRGPHRPHGSDGTPAPPLGGCGATSGLGRLTTVVCTHGGGGSVRARPHYLHRRHPPPPPALFFFFLTNPRCPPCCVCDEPCELCRALSSALPDIALCGKRLKITPGGPHWRWMAFNFSGVLKYGRDWVSRDCFNAFCPGTYRTPTRSAFRSFLGPVYETMGLLTLCYALPSQHLC